MIITVEVSFLNAVQRSLKLELHTFKKSSYVLCFNLIKNLSFLKVLLASVRGYVKSDVFPIICCHFEFVKVSGGVTDHLSANSPWLQITCYTT